jgi:hypothetical protein
LAASLRHRGAVAADAEDWTTARDRCRRGLEIADRLAADATGPQAEVMQLGLLRQLAECHRRLGEAAEAAACEARLDGLQVDPAVPERSPGG